MDASQEITALGLCNFVGSFIGSLPITASFGRSAINSASGVRTPFGGVITGLIVLAGLKNLFFTEIYAFYSFFIGAFIAELCPVEVYRNLYCDPL